MSTGAFTCPMHPEVVSDVPGACPKCGMALERAHTTAEASPEDNHELTSMQRRFAVCAVFTVPLVVIAMGMLAPPWVEFLLALPVVTGGAWPIWERAALSIRHAHPNMFTLIGLGTAASLAFSVPQIGQHHGNTYFEASAVIVTLVLLGQVLELRARESTRDALRSLLALTPISPFRPRLWRGPVLSNRVVVTFRTKEPQKRPVSAVADNVEFHHVVEVVVREKRDQSVTLLFDPGSSLEERVLIEQFRY